MKSLRGTVVAITGASSGIGRATAVQLADAGASVVVSARRAERLDAFVNEVRAAGGTALAVTSDVTREGDMRHLVDQTVHEFGRIDVMICNAGIGYHGALDATPPDDMRRVVDVNVMGTFFAAQAALVAMRRQGRGHIIAVSSVVGRRGVGGSSVYAATKAAQVTFIESLRAEFVGTDLHASVVFPISTTTEFHDAIARDFGHAVTGRGPSQSAEHVARAIVRCVRAPRAEVHPSRLGWLLGIASVIAPAQTDKVIRHFGRRRTPHPNSARG